MIRAFRDCYNLVNLTHPVISGYGDLRNSSASLKYWNEDECGIKILASLIMDITRPGYVLLIFSGYAVLSSSDRIMDIGIGTNRKSIRNNVVVETARFYLNADHIHRIPFAVSAVIPVLAGRSVFYGLAKGRPEYKKGKAFINSDGMSGTLISGR